MGQISGILDTIKGTLADIEDRTEISEEDEKAIGRWKKVNMVRVISPAAP